MTTTQQPPAPAVDAGTATESRPAEESALARLAGWCHDHRWWVLVVWWWPWSGSTWPPRPREQLLQQPVGRAPSRPSRSSTASSRRSSGSPAQVVITTTAPFTDPANRARTEQLAAALAPLPHVAAVTSPFAPAGAGQISRDGHIGYIRVNFDEAAGNLPTAAIQKVGRHRAVRSPAPATTSPSGARPSVWWPGRSPGRARGSGSWPPSSSCCWPSARWWPWACPSSPPCSGSPWPSPCSTC